jgi:predicted transcriptional regulator
MSLEYKLSHNDGIATRKKILKLIRRRPGIHYRGIRKELELGNSCAGHNLKRMEDEGIIKSRKNSFYRRYYALVKSIPDYHIGEQSVYIAELLKSNEGASQNSIARVAGVSWAAVQYHKKRLEAAGEL